jgi:formamidopyrimidine-DNA glycosylase
VYLQQPDVYLVPSGGVRLGWFELTGGGTFKVADAAEMRRKQAEIGPDIMWPLADYKVLIEPVLKERIRRFGAELTLAEATLDQRFFAGCGNYIRADGMYLARLSPHRKLYTLHDSELWTLWCSLAQIARASYENHHPLVGHGPEFDHLCYGREASVDGHPVYTYEDRTGRTVHWCPTQQH